MHITEEDLEALVRDTWAPTLQLFVDAPTPPDGPVDVHGHVVLSGAWDGRVTVQASRAAVAAVAAKMFGHSPDNISDEDALDAIGEMANVLGGNVKPFAGGECEMSLPTTASGAVDADGVVADIGFTIDGNHARLTVQNA